MKEPSVTLLLQDDRVLPNAGAQSSDTGGCYGPLGAGNPHLSLKLKSLKLQTSE